MSDCKELVQNKSLYYSVGCSCGPIFMSYEVFCLSL